MAWGKMNSRLKGGIGQWFPNFLAAGMGFVEDNFSMDQWGGWFGDDSRVLHLLCTLFLLLLHELHLKSSGLRSQRLGAHGIGDNERSKTWKDRDQLKGFLPPVLRLQAEAFSKILPLTLCQLLCLWVKLLDFSLCFLFGPKGHSIRAWHFEN